jgi:hypothetical protein
MAGQWTLEELHEQLARYEDALRTAGMTSSTIQTYVDRPRRFLKWLGGDYQPTKQ